MFNWLGTWLGGWFGSGDPAPPGSMSGVASVSISTVATLASTGSAPGMMSGTAALAISTTATITHATPVATGNFWAEDPGCYLSDAEVGAASTALAAADAAPKRRTIRVAEMAAS